MLSRRTIFGALAGVLGVAMVGSVVAFAQGPGGGGHAPMMRRMAFAMIDDALAAANVTPEQRTAIYASRDRVFAAMDAQRQDHRAQMDQALTLFEGDTLDPAQVAAFRAQRESAHQQMADAISQAFVEVH
ncbi:MAG TPA: periplasmic heavy metal sensor, partial [Methylomirabilota bacterium]|nr:periplasmic heavy metal sensor [Methylomirabilota bacterium]